MPETVQVALPLPLDQPFTYTVPPHLRERAGVGCRVLVPFGHRSQTGVIVGVGDSGATGKLKAILDVLDDQPAFTDTMLRLTRWMADYYVCGWGEVLRAALPSGTDVAEERSISRTEKGYDEASIGGGEAAVLRWLEEEGETTFEELRQAIHGVTRPIVDRLEAEGLIVVRSAVGQAQVRIKQVKYVRRLGAPAGEEKLGDRQQAVLDALADGEVMSQRDLLATTGASASTLTSLAKRGYVEVIEREVIRTPLGEMPAVPDAPPNHAPHPAQVAALERMGEAIDAGRFETFLLQGVTGSGKTEVYIAALKRVLEQGKTGIILVPEIALTPQTVQRFRAHFGDRIAVLHSRMSPGERYDAWRHLRGGRFDVVIGPRSAILAPLENVGLIVVDEEHEGSYKQADPAPRYHARDVAVMRAHMSGAVCVLGSATPSFESYVNAREAGKYTLLLMPHRVPVPGREAASLPEIRVVDLTKERKKHKLPGALSEALREGIALRLTRGEQVILLQNRRGYAPVIECMACGWSPACTDCSVTLTYHKAHNHLRCHYCGKAERMPRVCGQCGSTELSRLGAGTQRVEEELAAYFPAARVLRMDLDTTTRKNAHHALLDRFGRGDADILVGTQMVAKGLDFGRVTLVGVIDADVGMLIPDFRAEERSFQLLTQVAGRSGRAGLCGEVLLQTRNPRHPVIQFACAHDVDGFVRAALPGRQEFGYPPYGSVTRVEFRGPEEKEVERLAQRWAQGVPAGVVQVLEPQPALIGRVKNQFRYHVVLKATRRVAGNDLQRLLREATTALGALPHGYRLAVDVDANTLY
ncbi:MAG: primosomal protein N' [Rhodothermales bacterium]|nr:primosomal protein N' [Rhodothermales bacterium]